MSSPHILHTTDATFSQDVLKSDKPVLLDFWAEWCGPCKMIAPILDEIAAEYHERIKIAKLNIDENPQTPPKFGIRGIPTLILFKNGSGSCNISSGRPPPLPMRLPSRLPWRGPLLGRLRPWLPK